MAVDDRVTRQHVGDEEARVPVGSEGARRAPLVLGVGIDGWHTRIHEVALECGRVGARRLGDPWWVVLKVPVQAVVCHTYTHTSASPG